MSKQSALTLSADIEVADELFHEKANQFVHGEFIYYLFAKELVSFFNEKPSQPFVKNVFLLV